MGGFLLIRRKDGETAESLPERFARSFEVFERRGQDLAHTWDLGQYTLYLYHKIQVKSDQWFESGSGDMIAASGTLIYNDKTGPVALEDLYAAMRGGSKYETHLRGNFTVIAYINGTLSLFTDLGGIYRVYETDSGECLSSSFLAVCRHCQTLTIAPQEYYEYIYNGACYGGKTFVKEVSLLSNLDCHILDEGRRKVKREAKFEQRIGEDFDDAVMHVSDQLLGYFSTLHTLFDNSITAALSGGYDSRLVLALARNVGIDLDLYVYGRASTPDVQVAKRIAEGEHLSLKHIDKNAYPKVPREEFPDYIWRNFYHFDGWNIVGVFDNGSDLDTRMKRTSGIQLQLNGGGGEIYRNFWELPNHRYTPMQFVQSRYTAIKDPVFQETYGEARYRDGMAKKIREVLGVPDGMLTRRDIERLYPLWRLRYWMSINNQVNNIFAYTLTPYAEPLFTETSYDIPLGFKNNGAFQAALINFIDPALAAYPSAYGYNFLDSLPLNSRLNGFVKRSIPVSARPFLRRWLRQSSGDKPYWLSDAYIATMLDLSSMKCPNFIDTRGMSSAATLSRVYSVELLLQDCIASLSSKHVRVQ